MAQPVAPVLNPPPFEPLSFGANTAGTARVFIGGIKCALPRSPFGIRLLVPMTEHLMRGMLQDLPAVMEEDAVAFFVCRAER